jgi:hypothetical protein
MATASGFMTKSEMLSMSSIESNSNGAGIARISGFLTQLQIAPKKLKTEFLFLCFILTIIQKVDHSPFIFSS